jgi:hypothetical protein
MVLDGLEDNDDFWNVVPSDDEVYPRTDDRIKDRQDATQSPRVFNTDTSPEMLPNGRYRY